MTKLPKLVPFVLLTSAACAMGQALPADTGTPAPGVGFSLPTVGGSLTYGLSAAELISTGFYNTGTSYTTSLSGDMGYVSRSQRHPFSAVYDGGILLANSGQPTSTFQSLSFSQILNTKRWNLAVSDSVSYLPESPVGGLSGVAGVGDLGVDPVAISPTSGLGILTTYGPRVSNTLSGTVGRQLTGRLSLQGTGTFGVQRFIGDNSETGLNSTTEGGSGGLSYHLSARDTLTGNYNYSNFSYSGTVYSFSAQGATAEYSRNWSARLVTDIFAGPQIISGSNPLINGSSVQIAAGASASYLSRSTSYSVAYFRGANNGSGVIPGSFSDNINAVAHRRLGRDWDLSGNVLFSRNVSLPNLQILTYNSRSVSFGGQGTRRFGRYFSGYASYTLEDQSSTESVSPLAGFGGLNAFNGVYQIFGIGVSYSPRSILLGR